MLVEMQKENAASVGDLFAVQQWNSDMFLRGGPKAAIITLRKKDMGQGSKQINQIHESCLRKIFLVYLLAPETGSQLSKSLLNFLENWFANLYCLIILILATLEVM